MSINLVLLILAFICLLLASLGISTAQPPSRVHLGWLGLAFWVLSLIVHV